MDLFASGRFRVRWRSLAQVLVLGAATLGPAGSARAQFAVIDVASVTQLVSQLETMQQQLSTTREQLAEARAQLQSMRGGRGMERLLADTPRNYLPQDWTSLQDLLAGSGGAHAALASRLRGAIDANAVLSGAQLDALAPHGRQHIEAARRSAALYQVLSSEALAVTSARFGSLQAFIDAIGSAGDQKAILDLQARIAAEQSMLENEQTKLRVLHEAAQAQERADLQRLREQIVAGHGRFDTRFQPVPR